MTLLEGDEMRRVLFSLLFFGAAANASNWMIVTEATTGAKHYVDVEGIVSEGDVVKFWGKIDYSKDKTVGYREEKQRFTVNCRSRTLTLVSYTTYRVDGTLIRSVQIPYYSQEAREVAPDTVGEAKLDFVCLWVKS